MSVTVKHTVVPLQCEWKNWALHARLPLETLTSCQDASAHRVSWTMTGADSDLLSTHAATYSIWVGVTHSVTSLWLKRKENAGHQRSFKTPLTSSSKSTHCAASVDCWYRVPMRWMLTYHFIQSEAVLPRTWPHYRISTEIANSTTTISIDYPSPPRLTNLRLSSKQVTIEYLLQQIPRA